MSVHKVYIYFIDEGIAASFDGAWQKRGSGRCHNSLTGNYVHKFLFHFIVKKRYFA